MGQGLMARPEQLAPYGAINPTSKPVSAFVEPNSQIVLGQPQQPAQFNAQKESRLSALLVVRRSRVTTPLKRLLKT